MIPEYAAAYRELYQHHWWWRARETLLLGEIDRRRPPTGWRRILDVGCGDGLFFDRLAGFGEVWGVESDPALIPADSRHRARIHVGPFDAGYAPNRRFDLVLMLDVLEHMADPVSALRKSGSLLEPDGRILVTVPAFPVLWTSHDDLNQHFVRYRRRSLAAVVRDAGLRIISQRYFFQWLFAAKLAVRAFESLDRRPRGPAVVPPAPLNRFLTRLSIGEQLTIGRLGLPFGSSLMAWCGRGADR